MNRLIDLNESKNVYKILVIFCLLSIICYKNIQYTKYHEKYLNTKTFSKNLILQKKYRCIRYFDEKDYHKYFEKKCNEFKRDYLNFQLRRSLYFYEIIKNNIMLSFFIIIISYL